MVATVIKFDCTPVHSRDSKHVQSTVAALQVDCALAIAPGPKITGTHHFTTVQTNCGKAAIFQGPLSFMSNYFPSTITGNEFQFLSAEHAYQHAKAGRFCCTFRLLISFLQSTLTITTRHSTFERRQRRIAHVKLVGKCARLTRRSGTSTVFEQWSTSCGQRYCISSILSRNICSFRKTLDLRKLSRQPALQCPSRQARMIKCELSVLALEGNP